MGNSRNGMAMAQPQEPKARGVSPVDAPARGGRDRQHRGSEREAQRRDDGGREVVDADRDEVERGAPHDAAEAEEPPVDRPERLRPAALPAVRISRSPAPLPLLVSAIRAR